MKRSLKILLFALSILCLAGCANNNEVSNAGRIDESADYGIVGDGENQTSSNYLTKDGIKVYFEIPKKLSMLDDLGDCKLFESDSVNTMMVSLEDDLDYIDTYDDEAKIISKKTKKINGYEYTIKKSKISSTFEGDSITYYELVAYCQVTDNLYYSVEYTVSSEKDFLSDSNLEKLLKINVEDTEATVKSDLEKTIDTWLNNYNGYETKINNFEAKLENINTRISNETATIKEFTNRTNNIFDLIISNSPNVKELMDKFDLDFAQAYDDVESLVNELSTLEDERDLLEDEIYDYCREITNFDIDFDFDNSIGTEAVQEKFDEADRKAELLEEKYDQANDKFDEVDDNVNDLINTLRHTEYDVDDILYERANEISREQWDELFGEYDL